MNFDEDEVFRGILHANGTAYTGEWVDANTAREFYRMHKACLEEIDRLRAERNASSARPEGGVMVPTSLFYKILEQHQLAADALTDIHGDVHRYIVVEMERLTSTPQRD